MDVNSTVEGVLAVCHEGLEGVKRTKLKEEVWDSSKVVEVGVDLGEAGRERCSRRRAPIVKKNAKFLLSRAAAVPSTAKSVFQSAKKVAVK